MEPRPPGPAAGPLSYPDAKIVTANGASRPSAPAINPDERSGLEPAGLAGADINAFLLRECGRVSAGRQRDGLLNFARSCVSSRLGAIVPGNVFHDQPYLSSRLNYNFTRHFLMTYQLH